MNALAIDCAVSRLTIAGKKENQVITVSLDIGNKQSERLLPTIDYIFRELSMLPLDLDYTTITLGPGTFTGLRLGLSSLKALSLSNGISIYGVDSLEAYAFPYRTTNYIILSLIEAKDSEFFCSIYEKEKTLLKSSDLTFEEIVSFLDTNIDLANKSIILCGPASDKFLFLVKNIPSLRDKIVAFNIKENCCQSLFTIAEEMIKNNISPLQDYDGPLYVRKSEAEIVLEKNQSKLNFIHC